MKKLIAALLGALLVAPVPGWTAPNDPYFSHQWGLTEIGADDAWRRSTGRGVIVAVIDTGVDPSHPDLKGRLLAGKDFVDDDEDPRDENGHGTLIAGIVAASTGNGVGVASVAPKAKVLPVRVLDADGTGVSSDVADGIDWAVARGVDVINLSLAQEGAGGRGGVLGDELLGDPSVGDAIKEAARAGVTVVVAAGNDRGGGRSETAFDAEVGGVVVVGASTKTDQLAAYSNYGAGLDIVAPGGGSASNPRENGCTQLNSIVSTWWDPEDRESTYGGGCGTSMAVGFVSGVAALLHARGMSNVQVVQKMLSTAKDLGAPGRDDRFGHGRLDAARALGVTSKPKPKQSASTAPRPKPSEERGTVVVQGDPDPISTPSETPTASAPARPRRAPEPLPPVAFPAGLPEQTKGWPVSAAAGLVSVLVLAHVLVFLRRAEQRTG